MKKMRQSRFATFMHNLKFAVGIGFISMLFITAARCNKADELIGPIPAISTEVVIEGDSLVYLKAWDTVKKVLTKQITVADSIKPTQKPVVQKAKKKKVIKKKKYLSTQDRENAEFEKWYRKTHKK